LLVNLSARESVLESARARARATLSAPPALGEELFRFVKCRDLHALVPIACIAAGNRTPLDTLDPAFFIDTTAGRSHNRLEILSIARRVVRAVING
jgi:hypothetical protein